MPNPVAKARSIALRLQRKFAAPREAVFRAWTNPETLKRWWCPSGWTAAEMEVDLRVSGVYRLGMRRLDRRSVVAVRGRFLEVVFPERLVYTWRWEGVFEDLPETTVTVQFSEIVGGTAVVLIQEHFPDAAVWHRHRSGWIAACDRMEQIL